MESRRPVGAALLCVLFLMGMIGEASAPKPERTGPAQTAAEWDAAQRQARQEVLANHPGAIAFQEERRRQEAADAAARIERAKAEAFVYDRDADKDADDRDHCAVWYHGMGWGAYDSAAENGIEDRFWDAMTGGEKARWKWDRFRRWLHSRGFPVGYCTKGPAFMAGDGR